MTVLSLLTADDLQNLVADGSRYDLIEGELIRMEPAGFFHGTTTIHLSWPLAQWVDENDLGAVTTAETGFLIEENPDTVLAPDIGFVAKHRLPENIPQRGYFQGAPDLAVEVVSPSETVESVDIKVQKYLAAGTQLVWVLRPSLRRVEIHRANGQSEFLSRENTLSGEEVVPGFSLAVARIFR